MWCQLLFRFYDSRKPNFLFHKNLIIEDGISINNFAVYHLTVFFFFYQIQLVDLIGFYFLSL